MKMTLNFVFGFPTHVARDNEGGGEGQAGDAGAGDTGAAQTPAADANVADTSAGTVQGDGKTFTQEDVNKIVVQRNKALKAQYESLEQNYQAILEEKNLTVQQRQKIEGDLANVQAQLRTKEEQARLDAKKAAEAHEAALTETQKEAAYYRNLYETSTIEREISQAAAENGGYNPQQFVNLVKPSTKLVEELDAQGQKTGNFVPRVETTVVGEDGTPSTVLKSVGDYVAGMKETDPNLFKNNVAKGIGQGTDNRSAGPLDPKSMSTEEYIANKEAMRKQIGYTPRR